MRNFKETIGKKIKERRKALGFKTQEALGIAVGADRTRVSRWESGENLPDPVYRDKLIEKLGLASAFFDEMPASESPQDHSFKGLEAKIDALVAQSQPPTPTYSQDPKRQALISAIVATLAALNDSDLATASEAIADLSEPSDALNTLLARKV